ncbi:MAG: formylglycine-generating enzyme family protein [Phycisphaerae bacterium]|nr:formylglycine-generating enzyme family protein [Phycisphaerae bacterium]
MNGSNRQKRIGVLALCIVAVLAGSVIGAEDKLPKKYTETIKSKTGAELSLEMVLVSGGSFTMGSPATEADRNEDEGPQRKVSLDPFYLCSTETTLELFMVYYQETGTAKKEFVEVQEAQKNAEPAAGGVNTITGPTPVYGDMTMGYSVKHPAIGMTWHNASVFCQWLAQKTGKPYRLPTEAEWEYAARAGTTSAYGPATDAEKLGDYAWYEDNSDFGPGAVATKKPNAWGFYDMQGNVREWVHDFYQPNGYADAATKNPTGPADGKVHVARGGCYDSPPADLRCAARAFEEDWWRMNDPQIPKSKWWLPQIDFVGFRVACSIPKDTK